MTDVMRRVNHRRDRSRTWWAGLGSGQRGEPAAERRDTEARVDHALVLLELAALDDAPPVAVLRGERARDGEEGVAFVGVDLVQAGRCGERAGQRVDGVGQKRAC